MPSKKKIKKNKYSQHPSTAQVASFTHSTHPALEQDWKAFQHFRQQTTVLDPKAHLLDKAKCVAHLWLVKTQAEQETQLDSATAALMREMDTLIQSEAFHNELLSLRKQLPQLLSPQELTSTHQVLESLDHIILQTWLQHSWLAFQAIEEYIEHLPKGELPQAKDLLNKAECIAEVLRWKQHIKDLAPHILLSNHTLEILMNLKDTNLLNAFDTHVELLEEVRQHKVGRTVYQIPLASHFTPLEFATNVCGAFARAIMTYAKLGGNIFSLEAQQAAEKIAEATAESALLRANTALTPSKDKEGPSPYHPAH